MPCMSPKTAPMLKKALWARPFAKVAMTAKGEAR